MNYLQPFAGLCTENFRWNVWIDAAYLGNFALPYNPDKKEKKTKNKKPSILNQNTLGMQVCSLRIF